MRLVGYGPGEICDRLSILALKIQYGRKANKEVDHFEEEARRLLRELTTRVDRIMVEAAELVTVNAGIWANEDRLRERRQRFKDAAKGWQSLSHLEEVGTIAFSLQRLNDRRHELIGRINEIAGHDHPKEKV